MALSLADVIQHVRDLLNESTAAFFSDAEITRWIQAGTLDISTVTHCIQTSAILTMATNTPSYALPTSTIDVLHAFWTTTRAGLRKITGSLQGEASTDLTGSVPLRYYVWGALCYIEPVPNATANGGTVTILHSLALQDVTQLQDACQVLAIWYATAMGKLKDKRYQEGAMLLSMYNQGLALRRTDIYERKPQAATDVQYSWASQLVGQKQG